MSSRPVPSVLRRFAYLKQVTYGTHLDHATVQISTPLDRNWKITRWRRYYVTGLVEWRQPISAAASSLVGVHRDDRRFEQNRCFCCRGNRIPVSVGDLFDVEVLNRSRAFRMYWKFSCHEAAQAGPALISDGPLPHSDKHTSQYCWKVCARRPGGALSTHLLSVSPFGRIQGKTT